MQELSTYFSGKFGISRIILIPAHGFSLRWKAKGVYFTIPLTPARDFFNFPRAAFFSQASRDNCETLSH
jgi:hypothetical protein